MRLAVLSDVHGNLPALDAVVADMGRVDAVLCLGDLVGYYPDTAAVVDRVRSLGAIAVRGNHELMLLGLRPVPPGRAAYYRTEEARAALTPEQRAWLAGLPPARSLTFGDTTVELRHASPWDEETYLYPDSPRLAEVALPPGRILLLGHTHHPLQARAGEGLVANPGSVGQPRDRDPRAAYAILEPGARRLEQRRVAYDHRAYQRRLAALGFHPLAVELLGRERGAGGASSRT